MLNIILLIIFSRERLLLLLWHSYTIINLIISSFLWKKRLILQILSSALASFWSTATSCSSKTRIMISLCFSSKLQFRAMLVKIESYQSKLLLMSASFANKSFIISSLLFNFIFEFTTHAYLSAASRLWFHIVASAFSIKLIISIDEKHIATNNADCDVLESLTWASCHSNNRAVSSLFSRTISFLENEINSFVVTFSDVRSSSFKALMSASYSSSRCTVATWLFSLTIIKEHWPFGETS